MDKTVSDTIKDIKSNAKNIICLTNQLKENATVDVVEKEKYENEIPLDDAKTYDMKKGELISHYEGKCDIMYNKVEELKKEMKDLDDLYSNIDGIIKELQAFMTTKESMVKAYNMNINNIHIVQNRAVKELVDLHSKDLDKFRNEVNPSEHQNPKDAFKK